MEKVCWWRRLTLIFVVCRTTRLLKRKAKKEAKTDDKKTLKKGFLSQLGKKSKKKTEVVAETVIEKVFEEETMPKDITEETTPSATPAEEMDTIKEEESMKQEEPTVNEEEPVAMEEEPAAKEEEPAEEEEPAKEEVDAMEAEERDQAPGEPIATDSMTSPSTRALADEEPEVPVTEAKTANTPLADRLLNMCGCTYWVYILSGCTLSQGDNFLSPVQMRLKGDYPPTSMFSILQL